jgi:cytochrome c oxidase subunit III
MAGAHKPNHEYHLVDPSPWPFIGSIGVMIMAIGAIGLMRWNVDGELTLIGLNFANPWIFLIGLLVVCYTMFGWWRDTIRESHEGHHTRVVGLHLRYGMILFIASEVMFFVAWFWAFFDASLFPDEAQQVLRVEHTGGQWPPEGIEVFDPWHLPLFNTLILLTSGTTVTWAHHALLENDRRGLVWGLLLTVLLGVLFSIVQAYEYAHAAFTFSGGIYGATFFMATGFHGFHVLVGTIFLLVCLLRALAGHFTPEKHFGFEAAAWYWHFVDVVWLFLFAAIYVWGAGPLPQAL